MIVTKVLCDNCGKEIEGKPFITMRVGYSGEGHYCFECSKVLLDAWNAAAVKSQVDIGLRKMEEMTPDREERSSAKVEIEWMVDLLSRNGVQWPNRSHDIHDPEMLKLMWNRIIRDHLAAEIARRKEQV